MGSRNSIDALRNDERWANAVHKLAGQGWWVEGESRTAPCSLSVCNYLSRGCTAVLEKALVDIVTHMMRLKMFDGNGAPYSGQFATSLEVRDGKEADDIGKWGRRRWDIESSFHRVPQAVKCNGWPGCPQDTLGMVPSAIRRVAAHCLEMARTTVAHPPNRLQMARAARRSQAAGVICNS